VAKRGNGWKWAFGAVALVAVAAVAVAATLFFTRGGSPNGSSATGSGSPSSGAAAASGIASANDTGPVTIITEDPTCAPWNPIQNTLHNSENNGWLERDPSIPASAWTTEQRAQYQAVGQAMRSASDQTVPLVKLTPHRVMRELYEQMIAYSRAYADHIVTYTPPDNELALTASTAGSLIGDVCAAISYGSAAGRAPLVSSPPRPGQIAPLGNLTNPKPFLTSANPVCPDWRTALDQFDSATTAWRSTDPTVPASQWSPEQKAINDAVAAVMTASADTLQRLGTRSGNPVFEDFAVLAAQYRRAYAHALPTYVVVDNYLANAAVRTAGVNLGACKAVEVS
jgi:hypothetical protein